MNQSPHTGTAWLALPPLPSPPSPRLLPSNPLPSFAYAAVNALHTPSSPFDATAEMVLQNHPKERDLYVAYGLLQALSPGGGRSVRVFKSLYKADKTDVATFAAIGCLFASDVEGGRRWRKKDEMVGVVVEALEREKGVKECVEGKGSHDWCKLAVLVKGLESSHSLNTRTVYDIAGVAARIEGGAGIVTDAWMRVLWGRGDYGLKKSDAKLRRKIRMFKRGYAFD